MSAREPGPALRLLGMESMPTLALVGLVKSATADLMNRGAMPLEHPVLDMTLAEQEAVLDDFAKVLGVASGVATLIARRADGTDS